MNTDCDLYVAEVCGVKDVLFSLSIAGSLWEHPRLRLRSHSATPAPHGITPMQLSLYLNRVRKLLPSQGCFSHGCFPRAVRQPPSHTTPLSYTVILHRYPRPLAHTAILHRYPTPPVSHASSLHRFPTPLSPPHDPKWLPCFGGEASAEMIGGGVLHC